MALEPLPPIPTPLNQRWREFRIQVLPVLFFILIVAALVIIWRNYLHPTNMVGEVEAVRANASSIMDGTLVELAVDRFDRVTKGQVMGRVETANPAFLLATLASVAADLRLMKAQMDLDRTRNLDSYARMRLNLLTEKVALNLAKIRSVQAEKEYGRVKKLYDEGVIPAGEGIGVASSGRDVTGYDVALRDRDALQAEIEDRTKLVAEWEKEMQRIESVGVLNIPGEDALVQEAIRAKEQEVQQTLAPVDLIAPIDGIISLVYRRPGERIVRGEPILTISATESRRIVGYVRMPADRVPSVQDAIEVRTRGVRRIAGQGRVLEVGAQMEIINPTLISTDSNWVELGLPILISVPEEMRTLLRPGEVVDLRAQFAKDASF